MLQTVAGEDEKPGDGKRVCTCVLVCVCVFVWGCSGNEMISKSYQEELRWRIGIHYRAAFNQEPRWLSGEVSRLSFL